MSVIFKKLKKGNYVWYMTTPPPQKKNKTKKLISIKRRAKYRIQNKVFVLVGVLKHTVHRRRNREEGILFLLTPPPFPIRILRILKMIFPSYFPSNLPPTPTLHKIVNYFLQASNVIHFHHNKIIPLPFAINEKGFIIWLERIFFYYDKKI